MGVRRLAFAAALSLLLAQAALAQTTQGLIAGRVVNSLTGRPVDHAKVLYSGRTELSAGNSLSIRRATSLFRCFRRGSIICGLKRPIFSRRSWRKSNSPSPAAWISTFCFAR